MKEDLTLPPEVRDSIKTAVQVALAADEMMMNLGSRATDAVCQSVRAALDGIWSRLAVKEAASILKDIHMGMKVKSGEYLTEQFGLLDSVNRIPIN